MFLPNTQYNPDVSLKDQYREISDKFTRFLSKSGTNSGLVRDADVDLFLTNGLERIDPYLHKPLSRFWWYQYMPVLYGGGALEYSAFFRTNYFAQDASKYGTSGNNNIITQVTASIEKFQTIVKAFAWSIDIGYIDQLKLAQVGSSILEEYDRGVRLYYNQTNEEIAFNGFSAMGNPDSYGLINNPNTVTTTTTIPFNNTSQRDQIVYEINTFLQQVENRKDYSSDYVTNMLLLPPTLYTLFTQPMTVGAINGANGTGVTTSIFDYLYSYNFVTTVYGKYIKIGMLPYLENAGAGGTRRIIAYCYNINCVRMPLPLDLTRGPTMFDISANSTKTNFVAFIGEPQFVYNNTMGYLDVMAG